MLDHFLMHPPLWKDALILALFCVGITFYPYYLNNRINVFELGLYLPGINGILHGLVPYKDFFHLRGPMELYAPAWLMKVFGVHMATLCFYFFGGNVLCLIVVILIARELMRSRVFFYMMVPVIIARAYPRVTFAIWGGMRYAFALMAVFCLIKFLKKGHWAWVSAAGFLTALAALTSIEMGVYAGLAAVAGLAAAWLKKSISRQETRLGIVSFAAAFILGITPWAVYASVNHAIVSYFDSAWTVVTRMQIVIDPHQTSIYPHNFSEAAASMLNPASINFRQMTVAYLYLFLLGYLIMRWRKGRWGNTEVGLLSLGVFGFIMYNTAFRGIWASQFEMALMPEKILYFFLIEAFFLWLWVKKDLWLGWQKAVIGLLVIAMFGFSIGYAMDRYNRRFWSYQYACDVLSSKSIARLKYWDKKEQYARLGIERVKGIWVPLDQYKDLTQLDVFIRGHSRPDDIFVMFPELGAYNFIFDRPFLGRFPIPTFTWFNDRWFEEYRRDLKASKAKYIIVQKRMPEDWYIVYFGYPPNKIKYAEMLSVIDAAYVKVAETDSTRIYERK